MRRRVPAVDAAPLGAKRLCRSKRQSLHLFSVGFAQSNRARIESCCIEVFADISLLKNRTSVMPCDSQ